MEILFFDLESSGRVELKEAGADVYTRDPSTVPYLITYARYGDWSPSYAWLADLSPQGAWKRRRPPSELLEAMRDPAVLKVAWNCRFDRLLWSAKVQRLPVEQTFDAMALAEACNLPGGLDQAGRALRLKQGKLSDKDMKRLMVNDPELLADMPQLVLANTLTYALRDTSTMMKIFDRCRALNPQEIDDYRVSERINDRGILIDRVMCEQAAKHHQTEQDYNNVRLSELTDGCVPSVRHHVALARWVYDRLAPAVSGFMVTRRNDEGEATGWTLAKDIIPILREESERLEQPMEPEVEAVLEVVEHGRSSSALKFAKMAAAASVEDDRLRGQFVFNGAGQTGRYSSRGAQLHNLARSRLEREQAFYGLVQAGADTDTLRELGGPVSYTLARLVRPTFRAPKGHALVWGDWSAIEARVLPWLSNNAEPLLELFRQGEDIYLATADDIFGRTGKAERQAGKVAVLSLGFGGATGAYRRMARGYGMSVDEDFARTIVRNWRSANPWARRFWDELIEAFHNALQNPGVEFAAGRVSYVAQGSDVYCFLPCGRALMYPEVKVDEIIDEEAATIELALRFRSKAGRKRIWHGLLAVNVTQATAASLLRFTLRKLDVELGTRLPHLVGHTHDEILLESSWRGRHKARRLLDNAMITIPDWAPGLPLDCEVTVDRYYHK